MFGTLFRFVARMLRYLQHFYLPGYPVARLEAEVRRIQGQRLQFQREMSILEG